MKEDLRQWLNTYRYGEYNGVEITPQTKIVTYTYVMSAVVVTFRHNTRYYFVDVEKGAALRAKILCILCNLICGWWGIPWGPIWTISETAKNIANANYKCWGEFAGRPKKTDDSNSDIENYYEDYDQPPVYRETAVTRSKESQKPKKKIKKKDLIIYILIGIGVMIMFFIEEGIL